MDLWYFFGWLGLELIKKNKGYVGYIAPTNWITNFGASKFRNYFLDNGKLVDYVDFGDFKVFEDAGIQTMIYIMKSSTDNDEYTFPYSKLLDKKSSSNDVKLFLNKSKSEKFEFFNSTINKQEFYDSYIQFNRRDIIELSNRIRNKGEIQLTSKEIAQGIVPPQDFINKKSLSILGDGFNLGDGIFNLTQNEYDKLKIPINEKEIVKPFYTSTELKRFSSNPSNKLWIIYTTSKFKSISEIEKYPTIKIPSNSKLYEELYDDISKTILELNELENNFLNSVNSRLSIEKKIKKIDEFDFLSYEDFILILKEEKQNLPPISDDNEWRDFINKSILKRSELKNSIDITEGKINDEILNLYEIGKEELLN